MVNYSRILLKLSGESLMGKQSHGIDSAHLQSYIEQIIAVRKTGVQIGIVIGGGNIFRGLAGAQQGFDRVKGDYMGMLATVVNGLALQSAFQAKKIPARLFTSIRMEPVADFWNRDQVLEALENNTICIFSGGTGNPYFTTDTTAALRAVEIKADVLLKGTRVDGVYSADPEKDPDATRFDTISFDEVIMKNLRIMDQTAFTLCRENQLPILVFDMDSYGNLEKLISGHRIGTLIQK
ncbi:MAG: UMP kinase [Bacteroidetes bacterium]|nr:UMP kinase [Bacteroidota bacterium]MBT3747899.1 UMP kinase [Bacteroidota bacterium]MBT4402245.1 UMP kinase [Bacteroidota bacterium]MBT4410449.1 UMP kinase [Bacteroidota bacterium]MBT5427070.1 UMP kinase [Bacteroidota bacterium]